MIYLHNTLTRQKEEFKPVETGRVSIYHCGPTVYNDIHIGNFRSYVFADMVRRVFEHEGYAVEQVVNITDIGHLVSDADEGEDKMSKGLRREGLELSLAGMKKLADKYTARFQRDSKKLNIKSPHHMPRASEHIEEQIALIKRLEEKGFIYTTSDGVYFNTSKDSDYGKLSRQDREALKEGARVGVNKEKRSPQDFALWKFSSSAKGDAGERLGWESPWGPGFPGWHIECSAMSMKHLGEHFDIHTGGIDHIPVHHENEIAQSESATGHSFVNYWLHHGHVLVDGGKMAKSEGNFITLEALEKQGYSPLAYRYWLLTADYKKTVNFTWNALAAAEEALSSLYGAFLAYKKELGFFGRLFAVVPDAEYMKNFSSYIRDDINTPQALSLVWKLVTDDAVPTAKKYATLLQFDKVLGLELRRERPIKVPREVKALIQERERARTQKDWQSADRLRNEIRAYGYQIDDTGGGPIISKRKEPYGE